MVLVLATNITNPWQVVDTVLARSLLSRQDCKPAPFLIHPHSRPYFSVNIKLPPLKTLMLKIVLRAEPVGDF